MAYGGGATAGDPFQAFLAARPARSPKTWPSGAKIADLPLAPPTDTSLERNPFAAYLDLRKPAAAVDVGPAAARDERTLREDVLKTKRQLLALELKFELQTLDRSQPDAAARLHQARAARRYLRHPERTLAELSDSSDGEDAPKGLEQTFPRKRSRPQSRASRPQSRASRPQSQAFDVTTASRTSFTATAQSSGGIQPPAPQVASAAETGYATAPYSGFRASASPSAATSPSMRRGQFASAALSTTTTATQRTSLMAKSMPNLQDAYAGGATASTMRQSAHTKTLATLLPAIGASTTSKPAKNKDEPLLSAWWSKTRCWNIALGSRDMMARRLHLDQPGGAVLLGNGRIPLYAGRHLLSPGYFYSFKIDGIDDERHPLESLRDLSFGFGVSRLPASHEGYERVVYAYEIPKAIVVGYGAHVIDGKKWWKGPWDPRELAIGDEVGVLITPEGDMVVLVNGVQKLRFPTSLAVDVARRRTLYPIVDLLGRVSAVTLNTLQGPPNIPLDHRDRLS